MTKYIVPNLYRRYEEDELIRKGDAVGIVLETDKGSQFFAAVPVGDDEVTEEGPETAVLKEQVTNMMTKIAEEGWHYTLGSTRGLKKEGDGVPEDSGHRTLSFLVTNMANVQDEDMRLVFPEEEFWPEGRFTITGSTPLAKACRVAVSGETAFTQIGLIASVKLDSLGDLQFELIPPEGGVVSYPDKIGGPIVALSSAFHIALSRRDKNGQCIVFQTSSAAHINGFFFNEENQTPRVLISRRVFEAQLGELDDAGQFTSGFTVPSAE